MQNFKEFLIANQDKKHQLDIVSTMPQYPTGYTYLDYNTGSYTTVYSPDEQPLYQYHNIGLPVGSVNTIIAKSQGGKSTLALGMATSIIEPYITDWMFRWTTADVRRQIPKKLWVDMTGIPMIQIADTERTHTANYAKKVARYTNLLTEKHIVINPVTTDQDLITMLEKHIKYKVETMQKIAMPMLDIFGRPIFEYPPTAFIVDSASQLLMEDCDDPSVAKKGGGILDIYLSSIQGTAGARRAKIISAMYSQLVNYAKKFNIIIFMINHINKMLPINGIQLKQYRGLKGGETINGGERAMYLTANILRLDVIKSIGYGTSTSLDLGPGITGFVAKAKWIKSKSNSKNGETQLVYTNEAGYDPLLSSLYYGKEVGDLPQQNHQLYIPGYSKYKFNLKNYRDTFAEHPELIGAYYDAMRDNVWAKLLDDPDVAVAADAKLMNTIREDIHNDEDMSRGDMNDMDDMFANMINT